MNLHTYFYQPSNIIDKLETALIAYGLKQDDLMIECINYAEALPDVAIFLKNKLWTQAERSNSLTKMISLLPMVDSVKQKKQRISIRFKEEVLLSLVKGNENKIDINTSDLLKGKKYLIDFCDPNANKAFHIGHLRNIILGNAIATTKELAGGEVVRQSVVCDIGRNISEAMAGYINYKIDHTPESLGIKPDHFIGNCYAQYVQNSSANHIPNPQMAGPIDREIMLIEDNAQDILFKWMEGDQEVIALWNKIRTWALTGQELTLTKLNISFDQYIFESTAMKMVDQLVAKGMDNDIFKYSKEGVLVYETGEENFSIIPLIRKDGFPTEYMRAVVLWYELQNNNEDINGSVHIMGDEWLIPMGHVEHIVKKLRDCPLYKVYCKIPYAMVRLHGSNMKSSSGQVILIDDLLQKLISSNETKEVVKLSNHILTPTEIANITIMSFFLSKATTKTIDFSWDSFYDSKYNPGWMIANAWARANNSERLSNAESMGMSENFRFILLQSQIIRRYVCVASNTNDPSILLKNLIHLCKWSLDKVKFQYENIIIKQLIKKYLIGLGVIPNNS